MTSEYRQKQGRKKEKEIKRLRIPQYGFVKKQMKKFKDQVCSDGDGRMYFPMNTEAFPDFEELFGDFSEIPWTVLLPMNITKRQPDFDFPHEELSYRGFVTVTNLKTHQSFRLYSQDQDFRAKRAVGLLWVTRCSSI